MVFLTGDLGFMALEPLRQAMGDRFINAGISEQNMVSMAAALASEGLDVWVYSIAPFCYARPFEQIRNDVAFHRLPVKLIGNGGGYGYGVMGPTHHAIEDYGVLLSLPDVSVCVPVFDEDLKDVVPRLGKATGPSYLRLGRGESPNDYPVPAYAPWRELVRGPGLTVIVVGPMAGSYIEAFSTLPPAERPGLWVISELPLAHNPLPAPLLARIAEGPGLCVIEEHVSQGSLASGLSLHLAERGIIPRSFNHLHARAHHYERYGSQEFLRTKSGLDSKTVLATILRQQHSQT